MSKTTKEINAIQRAISAIKVGNMVGLKKNIKEALLSKVRRKIDEHEKKLAKQMFKELE